jgi:hypothetical protein
MPTFDALRSELAVAAARLIADEGMSYGEAKQRALRDVLGDGAEARGALPDNGEIELELRRHLALFAADTHPALLVAMRTLALAWMERLAPFSPHLVGAVLGGTATEHSDIELHLFTDSAKDVEVHLMDAGIDFDADAPDSAARPAPQETLAFTDALRMEGRTTRVGVRLHVFDRDAIRVAPRHRAASTPEFALHPVAASGRADSAALRRLLAETA